MTRQSIHTNLLGRKVRTPTDEDARQAYIAQQKSRGEDPADIAYISASTWYPWMPKDLKAGAVGEIVAVYQDKDRNVMLLVNFDGALKEMLAQHAMLVEPTA